MGYADKLQRLCALRGLDQTTLAERVNLSKSSMSRIFSGLQEPKISLAYELARELGVTIDYLVDNEDDPEKIPADHLVPVSTDELAVLKIVRRLGVESALDRLIGIDQRPPGVAGNEWSDA
jgi:transcriptional regulator with XRE-family HTH domain